MNDAFYKQRAQEVRDLAAKADPFITQRLLDLAERHDRRQRKTSVPPLPPAVALNPMSERDGKAG